MNSSPNYRWLSVSIYAGAFAFGIVMASLGALLPGLTGKIGFDKEAAGGLFLFMNLALLIGSLIFGPICDRFGFRFVLTISTALVGGAFLGVASVSSYPSMAVALAIMGLGGGALNGGTNALLNDISRERRGAALNYLGIFFGFGALLTPLLLGALRESLGLERIIYLLSFLSLIPLTLFLLVRFPAPKHEAGLPAGQLAAFLKNPLLYLFGFLLFFQSGNEFAVGGWLSTYFPERFETGANQAAFFLSGYWAAIMVGRLLAGWISAKVRPEAMVACSALLALLAMAALLIAPSPAVAVPAVIGIGLGFAAIFPTTLAQAGGVFTQFSGTAFSVIFVIALTGGMTAPWLVGKIAQARSVETGMTLVVFNCAMIALLQGIIYLRTRRREEEIQLD